MARQRSAAGKDHRPWQGGIGSAAPQFAVDEIGDAPEKQTDRSDGRGDVTKSKDGNAVSARKPYHRHDAAYEAAVEGHASPPQFENLGRVLDEERQIVEQHIAGSAAQDDAERHPENEIVYLGDGDRR